VRRDFPQRLGLGVVTAAGLAFLVLAARPATFHWGVWVLVAAVIADVLLLAFVGRVTVCYRCRSEVRGRVDPRHEPFDLALAEKYRSSSASAASQPEERS
jgi:hypothetical protein